MNMVVILGVVRHLLTFGGGILISFGWADESTVQALSGALITLIGGVWSIVEKITAPRDPPG